MLIDADDFLDALVIPELRIDQNGEVVTPSDLPPDWYLEWDMRAAHIEYDGGLSRDKAEDLALTYIIQAMNPKGITLSFDDIASEIHNQTSTE